MKSVFDISDFSGEHEVFEDILKKKNIRIERILSAGQKSPAGGWYNQSENEFVLLLQGNAILEFEDGTIVELKAGEFFNISAHKKHKVSYTSIEPACIWIAVFYP